MNKIIEKCKENGVRVFLWETELWGDQVNKELRKDVILLRPYLKKSTFFKKQIFFPYFIFKYYGELYNNKLFDMLYVGNMFARQERFAEMLSLSAFAFEDSPKIDVFGDWAKNKEKRKFLEDNFNYRLKHINFRGQCNHCYSIPLLNSADATLHILPQNASEAGLFTSRVFQSMIAGTLCYVDTDIFGAKRFFPKELLVRDGFEITDRWKENLDNRVQLLSETMHAFSEKRFNLINVANEFEEAAEKYG